MLFVVSSESWEGIVSIIVVVERETLESNYSLPIKKFDCQIDLLLLKLPS